MTAKQFSRQQSVVAIVVAVAVIVVVAVVVVLEVPSGGERMR